ncbi:hypothetical protein SDC9_137370 [bioreactor metagenome]|uniref:Polymerase/histidinol phosphatase N-terminal domain-containing protein n=1 Tax=bioreactor metagenome TaxID=1076179 RepID=A0A645DLS4_9ZZZZ
MFYDLHIHSALSPCASNDMTPNNIINMAGLLNLDVIAVCDHNSTEQQQALHEVALQRNMRLVYGIEVQTAEEVHVLCYFRQLAECQLFGQKIKDQLIPIRNDPHYFGHQYVMDQSDEIIKEEPLLLLNSVMYSIEQVCDLVHLHHGSMVLAHALDRHNSIITQLGFIPLQLKFDGIEVKNISEKQRLLASHPWITETVWLTNSDAHYLTDINEPVNSI